MVESVVPSDGLSAAVCLIAVAPGFDGRNMFGWSWEVRPSLVYDASHAAHFARERLRCDSTG